MKEGHVRLGLDEGRDVVQNGDFVTLDFDGKTAGKPFAGAKGENYTLEVGSGHALPQFEAAVVGLKVGTQQTVQVNYPESYPNKEIAGKTVDFTIVVREIKQKRGDVGRLSELAVAWVVQNPGPIPLQRPPYRR